MLQENTTWHLIEDMETLRKHLSMYVCISTPPYSSIQFIFSLLKLYNSYMWPYTLMLSFFAADVDQWVLFGGSWGATLSLLYAQTHPDHVLAIIIRGVFAIRR